MQAETLAKIDTIKSTVGLLRKHVKYDDAKARLVDLEAIIADGDFWSDQENAQKTMREKIGSNANCQLSIHCNSK